MLKIVLDTNVILSAVSRNSPYRIVFDKLANFEYELCVSTSILLEYEEKLSTIFNPKLAELTMNLMAINPNIRCFSPSFQWRLIYPDLDDNKFADCAFTSNAHFLVTNDRDFNVLKKVGFPKFNLLKIEEFVAVLEQI
jgi:uncharacterized protein